MSIQTQTEKAFKNLREARKAILGRGGEIPPKAGLKDLANAIYNIPADTSLAFQEDDSIAYRKTVPSKAEEYALVSKVGGMSYKTKNLLPISTEASQTFNGITYTNNKDGTWTLNGTATERSYKYLMWASDFSPQKGAYTLSGAITDKCTLHIDVIKGGTYVNGYVDYGNGVPMDISKYDYTGLNVFVVINAGVTVNNLVIKPMFNEGTTALPYEPYFKGLRDTKVTSLESRGIDDGILGTFTIPTSIVNRDDWGRGVSETYYNGIEYRDGRWYYIKRTNRKVFDGTENTWSAYTSGWTENNANGKYCYLYGFGTSGKLLAYQSSVCNMFNNVDGAFWGNNPGTNGIGNYCDHTSVANCYFVTSYPTLAEWKAHLAELYASGNPLIIEYALAEPIEEDITDLINSGFLKVEGGGSVIAYNAYAQDAPSTIKYTVKVGS